MTRIRVFAAAILVLVLCAGRAHAQAKAVLIVPTSGPLAGQTLYHASYALIIGINRYRDLPAENALNYAVKDAVDLRYLLIRRYGFPAGNITLLTDDQATKAAIESALSDLADSSRITADDRVLVFFSGHGQTVPTAIGGEQGFLLPCDADVDLAHPDNAGPYLKTCIRMATVWSYLDACPAKHVLVIADACYSGLLAQERSVGEISPKVLARMAALRARQVMTAGTKGQPSLEVSSLGHGLLTYSLLEQLRARVPTLGRTFTASDLFLQVRNAVRDYSQGDQIPQLASHDAEGDFLFVPTQAQPVPAAPADSLREAQAPPAVPALAKPGLSPEEQAQANAAFIGLWTGPDGREDYRKAAAVSLAQVRQALADGADLHAKDVIGTSALLLAAGGGNLDCIKFLMSRGLDIRDMNSHGATALTRAATSGNLDCLRFCLSQGVNINARNIYGETALKIAEENHHPDAAALLKAAGGME